MHGAYVSELLFRLIGLGKRHGEDRMSFRDSRFFLHYGKEKMFHEVWGFFLSVAILPGMAYSR